ncbi:MAG: thiamine diphosphokinase [Acidobacteria bacterium]|nr:thiamine diphosphokinase [Acidobacteriota bacterium]
MKEHAVLVANGPVAWTPELAALAAAGEPLLAADGGADALARIGLMPRAVIGDLDSISPETAAWVGPARLVSRPDQDRTDLEKALIYAFDEAGVRRLTVLGALGGRSDHEVGNLGLLWRLARGTNLAFRDAASWTIAVSGTVELDAAPGEIWSFWSFDPAVLVTLDGVRWPVRRVSLAAGGRPSISNEATASKVRVVAEGGAVIVHRRHR